MRRLIGLIVINLPKTIAIALRVRSTYRTPSPTRQTQNQTAFQVSGKVAIARFPLIAFLSLLADNLQVIALSPGATVTLTRWEFY
jgi:hypothetical protein